MRGTGGREQSLAPATEAEHGLSTPTHLGLDDLLSDRMRNPESFVGTRSPPKLVNNDQARPPFMRLERPEDHAHRGHLARKRRQRRLEVVVVRQASQEGRDGAEGSVLRGDKRADLGHDVQEGNLAQQRRLAAHVGPVDDLERGRIGRVRVAAGTKRSVRGKMRIGNREGPKDSLRHERAVRHPELLMERVTTLLDRQRVGPLGPDCVRCLHSGKDPNVRREGGEGGN